MIRRADFKKEVLVRRLTLLHVFFLLRPVCLSFSLSVVRLLRRLSVLFESPASSSFLYLVPRPLAGRSKRSKSPTSFSAGLDKERVAKRFES